MAYEKHTWVNNETITAAKMNNIETGIEEAAQSGGGGYDAIIKITGTYSLITLNSLSIESGTFSDIFNKLVTNKAPVSISVLWDGSPYHISTSTPLSLIASISNNVLEIYISDSTNTIYRIDWDNEGVSWTD